MTVLVVLACLPVVLALVPARGEPVRTINCFGAMGVGCLIACSTVVGPLRQRA